LCLRCYDICKRIYPKQGTYQTEFALDVYSSYNKFLLAGDFNVQKGELCIQNFK
jgi:hypothetical protein